MKKMLLYFLFAVLAIILILAGYLFVGSPVVAEKITWGANFSQKHTENLRLNWRETYLALLDDLKVRNLKIASDWDLLEPEKDKYYFDDLDWQIREAENRNSKIILVIGMKTGRWPECHIPDWAKNFSKEEQQREILEILEKIVLRYKDSPAIQYWQVENEPFFPFGECPWTDEEFLKKEVSLVKSLDIQKKSIIISDSGEGSFWVRAAKIGDIVGTTMYKKVWFSQFGIYVHYPFPPTFYWRKAQIIKKFFGKEVICIELQAEPWGKVLLYDSPLEEQEKSMNLEQFKENIEFAKKTGLDTFYLWGAEWWYWMKEKQGNSVFWEEARKLFSP